jgi:tRNA-binding EMAP/Myf-like protein
MSVITRQTIATYYDKYQNVEIMFSKEVTQNLHLVPRQIYIKCGGDQWPCIINSTSFSLARIIIGTRGGAFKTITKKENENENVSIRFCFAPPDSDIVSFFVNAHVAEVSKFDGNPELAIITLIFTQRPPDSLIESIGSIHAARKDADRRSEERIILTEEIRRKLQLDISKTTLSIEKVPRKYILRDISFSGAKVIIVGLAKFLIDKEVILNFAFEDPSVIIQVIGKIVNVESIENRKELLVISIHFDDDKLSLAYKIRLSNYFSTIRKSVSSETNEPLFAVSEDKNNTPVNVVLNKKESVAETKIPPKTSKNTDSKKIVSDTKEASENINNHEE